jgi:hypothetical protein
LLHLFVPLLQLADHFVSRKILIGPKTTVHLAFVAVCPKEIVVDVRKQIPKLTDSEAIEESLEDEIQKSDKSVEGQ